MAGITPRFLKRYPNSVTAEKSQHPPVTSLWKRKQGSEFTCSFHPASGQPGMAVADTTDTLTARAESMAWFPPHSQGEVLPSFISTVSGWPSVLLPLSEAAEYLSDTSTCQQAPDTSSADACDPFLQPSPATTAFSPTPELQGP